MILSARGEVGGPGDRIEFRRNAGRMERFDLAGNKKSSLCIYTIVQGFDPEPIACGKQTLLLLIPKQKGKHPQKAIQTSITPSLVSCENNLSIRLASICVIGQLSSKFQVVIDLTVQDYVKAAIGSRHRLPA